MAFEKSASPFFVAAVLSMAAIAAPPMATAHDIETSQIGARTTLYVFGPELPFMFDIDGERLDFAWSDIKTFGGTGLGTLENGAGEVIGLNGEFWVADPTDTVPRKLADEITPSGVLATFFPTEKTTISTTVNLEALQTILDEAFGDTEAYAYMFRATGQLNFVEYQLSGPIPNGEILEEINANNSQAAVAIGTEKYDAENIQVTLLGIRAPSYLNTVLQVPYHMHFISDDKSVLGHVTDLEADDLEIEWTRVNAINLHMWDKR
ncbi:MAG: acetolactate decarboxylase [Pseudomonadota bacterium]